MTMHKLPSMCACLLARKNLLEKCLTKRRAQPTYIGGIQMMPKLRGKKKKKHSPGLKTLRGSQPIYEIKQG